MNKNIENVSLDDVSLEDIEAVSAGADAVIDGAGDGSVDIGVIDAVAEKEEVVEEADVPVAAASAPVAVRKVGRPFDATGKTKLGRARLLYAENSELSVSELKALFQSKLDLKAQVAQTYASLVRRK